ncbi:hypothetical protein CRUP_003340 [Coryphaenoides rupestris]|nr:hypothetical protein CRUP_003340 [Coryphaenoides rupestris]
MGVRLGSVVADCLGPRPASFSTTALTNGNHHSPPMLNAVPSPPQRYSNGPSSSSSSSLANQQLPATCGARQLSKLKRFLTTLQQFGNDISPEIGESEATNFPLRPFVIPFLKVSVSLLGPLPHIVHTTSALQTLLKHRDQGTLEDECEGQRHTGPIKENGFHERPPAALEPAAKRICTISPAPRHSPAHPPHPPLSLGGSVGVAAAAAVGQLHPTPPPLQHYALDDIATPHLLHREHSQRMLELRELKDRPRLPGGSHARTCTHTDACTHTHFIHLPFFVNVDELYV